MCAGSRREIMPRYRFTAEDFKSIVWKPGVQDEIVEIANALLEQWEKDSLIISGHPEYNLWQEKKDTAGDTHMVILWNHKKLSE
jgi:hypothetical protein